MINTRQSVQKKKKRVSMVSKSVGGEFPVDQVLGMVSWETELLLKLNYGQV